jgi:SAM-dependent methyltransferase
MDHLKAFLLRELVRHFGEDVARIDHALRVLDHAEALLAETPEADPAVVRAAAVMHDFGIREAERLHGRCDGPLQEKYGPPLARSALERIGLDPARTREVCAIVARHHSPPPRPTVNFRLLYESDWLVNASDSPALMAEAARLESFVGKNFRTPAGRRRARAVLLREESLFARMGNVYRLMIDERRRRAVEGPYLLEIAEEARRAGASRKRPIASTLVLDLACGTGFHSRLLARAGYPVVAVDFSRSMLAEARRAHAQGAAVYRWGDLLKPLEVERPACLTLLLGNTLGLFQDTNQLDTVLRNAAQATRPGGIVLCQTLNWSRLRGRDPSVVSRRGRVEGRETVLTKSLYMDEARGGGVVLTFTASKRDEKGRWQTHAESTLLRPWTPKEIEARAARAGLVLEALAGSMKKDRFDLNTSADCVFRFRRAANGRGSSRRERRRR